MLIYVKKKKSFLSDGRTDGRTDTRSTQNYSSEPHNKKKKNMTKMTIVLVLDCGSSACFFVPVSKSYPRVSDNEQTYSLSEQICSNI